MADPTLPPDADIPTLRHLWRWRAALVALFAVQAILTLRLFGADQPWARVWDDEPIVSGQHPLHLYHGTLGAAAQRSRGSDCCYDPTFYAGYPKTPVFDSDCRAAEWSQLLAIGTDGPTAAYKVGLALCCWLAPFGLGLAARAVGLGAGTGGAAVGLGILLTWSVPALHLLEHGDWCLTLIGVTAALHIACLAGWHRWSSAGCWFGLCTTSALGWALHPLLWAGVTAVVMAGWLSVSRRHSPPWHAAVAVALTGALAVSVPGWHDWLRYWWIRYPLPGLWAAPADTLGPPPSIVAVFGEGIAERVALAVLLLAGIGGGLWRWAGEARCPVAWLALPAAITLALAGVSYLRPRSLPFSAEQLFIFGLWLAAVPVAHGVARFVAWLRTGAGRPHVGVIVGGAAFLLVAGVLARRPVTWELPEWGPRPLPLGLPPDARVLADLLSRTPTADARVLWEDRPGRPDLGWTVLLPRRVGRPFVGGLDPEGSLEHATIALRGGCLAGRPLPLWTDAELECYCRRYNVGWVVCSTEAARDRFGRWAAARALPTPATGDRWQVFAVARPHSFLLKGQARGFAADCRRVTLTDVVPENGEVVLSLHYQKGWRARPGWVQVERELDAYDPIPFVSLRVPGPVGRITLTWERP
jgi:hypothetical protein